MTCPKCGNELAPTMKFCAKCGTAVAQQPVQQQPPVAPNTPAQPPQNVPNQQPPIAQKVATAQSSVQANTPAPQNTPEKKKKDKPKGKKNNLGLKITAIILVIAVLVSGVFWIFDTLSYKNITDEASDYITDFPVLKRKTELMVYDEEKFPAEEYHIRVERMQLGGVLKSGKLFGNKEIVDEDADTKTFNIDFEKDGKYIITLTDITASRTQTTTANDTTEPSTNSEKEETKKDKNKVIIIEVEVDDDAEDAANKVDLNKNTDDKVPVISDEPSEDTSEENSTFIEATEEDFEELNQFFTRTYYWSLEEFDCNVDTMEYVARNICMSYGSLYSYFFDDSVEYTYENADPLGKYSAGYEKMPKNNVKWICENIFNLSFDEKNLNDEFGYVYEDYYYNSAFNAGGPGCSYKLSSSERVNNKYEIIFGCYDDISPDDEYFKKVTAEIKIIDGERYWSIYKIEEYDPASAPSTPDNETTPTQPSTENPDTAVSIDWKSAYNAYLKTVYNDKDGFNIYDDAEFCFAYITNDDIPELIISEGSCHAASAIIVTFVDGKAVNLGRFGSYGEFSYIEKGSVIVSVYARMGNFHGSLYEIKSNGSCDEIFKCFNNAASGNELRYEINDSVVTEEEYIAQTQANWPEESDQKYSSDVATYEFTYENIDKYCK